MQKKSSSRILLVEDNEINQMVATTMLMKLGYATTVANNGSDALRLLESSEFDLILMDCQMPIMDGYDTTEMIRKRNDHKRNIPILALTAFTHTDDFKRCSMVGMNDYITKPVTIDRLEEKIEYWLGHKPKVVAN